MNNVIICSLLAFVAVLTLFYTDKQDMKVCELSHSHDVCFTALNR